MQPDVAYNSTPYPDTKGRSASAPAQVANSCVLVVEDHEDTRFMIRTMLELHSGIRVVEAEDGESAVALAESAHPDLILMDTDLPLLDGIAATRRIREQTSSRDVPIIFLSGHAQTAAKARAFAAGGNHYLVKPFDFGEWDQILERYLSPGGFK